jgi:hypothetical protein
MTPPDPERTIFAAIKHYMPDLTYEGHPAIYPQSPEAWYKQDYLVVRATGGGASRMPHLWAVCYFEVEAFSSTRAGASLLARRTGSYLNQAAREGFRYEGVAPDGLPEAGYLFNFREVNAPSIIYDGLSSKHADTFMFQGTYQISVRALR